MKNLSIQSFQKELDSEKKGGQLFEILRQLTTVNAAEFEKDKDAGPAPLGAWEGWVY